MAGDGPGQWTTCVWHFLRRTYIFKNISFDLVNSRSPP